MLRKQPPPLQDTHRRAVRRVSRNGPRHFALEMCGGHHMVELVAVGALILLVLITVCLFAYKINARSFEFCTVICKLVSFSIKITSADGSKPSDREHQAIAPDDKP